MKVKCEIKTCSDVYEKDRSISSIEVSSNWDYKDEVEITVGENTVRVLGGELIKAVENCTNW